MTGIYVLTSARRGNVEPWRYLLDTIEHVESEKLPNPRHIVVDGPESDQFLLEGMAPGWTVHRYERPGSGTWIGGNKWPYFHLLNVALAHGQAGDDDALCLEDDLSFCVNAVRRMVLLEVPADVDWLQFFSAWLFTHPKVVPGLWRSPALMQGCQALKFPARTLAKLCAWAREDPEWQKYNESDVALGLAQQRLDLKCANHMPDLVQHAGDSSLVGHGMNDEAGLTDPAQRALQDHSLRARVSVNFSAKLDAMKLFARHDLYR